MRLELIHPLLVHFPIALLFIGTLVRFASVYAMKRPLFSFLRASAWLMLCLGVIFAWMTVVAGEVAADIVGPTVEKVTVLNKHQRYAYMTAIGFTLTVLLDIGRIYLLKRRPEMQLFMGWWVGWAIAFLYLFNITNLVVAGGFGAVLVYELGTAVETQ